MATEIVVVVVVVFVAIVSVVIVRSVVVVKFIVIVNLSNMVLVKIDLYVRNSFSYCRLDCNVLLGWSGCNLSSGPDPKQCIGGPSISSGCGNILANRQLQCTQE